MEMEWGTRQSANAEPRQSKHMRDAMRRQKEIIRLDGRLVEYVQLGSPSWSNEYSPITGIMPIQINVHMVSFSLLQRD